MKNKIREKTGNDLPKFLANYNKIKSHHSRQSSISSISSVTSEQSLKDDTNHKVSPQTDTAVSVNNIFYLFNNAYVEVLQKTLKECRCRNTYM